MRICERYDYAFLLESIGNVGDKTKARYSFLGFDPKIIINIKDGVGHIGDAYEKISDPLNAIREFIGREYSRDFRRRKFRFVGGAVGYISYDSVRYWERLPDNSIDDLGFPDVEMGIYDDGLIFDHLNDEVIYFYRGENRFDELADCLKNTISISNLSFSTPKVNIERSRYNRIIEKAKDYIFSGDIFQVVLSKRYSSSFKGCFEGFYLALRRINPSPYMYFLKMGNRYIIGSSPETLVRVEDCIVETYPIAGTRPITGDPVMDSALRRELLSDPKELAEHLMLLDLARNDLGKVSKYSTVKVSEFMKVFRYSHVQHIVSKVVGELKDSCDSFDAFRAVFPAGTVSGAPKVRAMEIIDELEGVRRGPYAGAVGYFSYNGNMDFAITIRTLFAKDGRFHIQVGSGIVADSTPEREWLETEFKAKALIKALEGASDLG